MIARHMPIRKRRPGPPRRGRIRDRKYLAFMGAEPCLISGERATIHHVRRFGEQKDDRRTLPLAPRFHQIGVNSKLSIEALGKAQFEEKYGVDLEAAIVLYNDKYRRLNLSATAVPSREERLAALRVKCQSYRELVTAQRLAADPIALVQMAIDRVRAARDKHREAQADPCADADDRGAARDAFLSAEREFGWQWENVDAILRMIEEVI